MNVFIAGGTSGIGLGLAKYYLSEGHSVGVCGRDKNKIQLKSENLIVYEVDIYEKDKLDIALNDFSTSGLDIIILSAGYYFTRPKNTHTYKEVDSLLRTNVLGMVNFFEAAREIIVKNGGGQIVGITSSAALINNPEITLHAKTKKAMVDLGKLYQEALAFKNVNVTIIAPGHINTKQFQKQNADHKGKVRDTLEVEEAVKVIVECIKNQDKLVIFPRKLVYLIKLINILPKKLVGNLLIRRKNYED